MRDRDAGVCQVALISLLAAFWLATLTSPRPAPNGSWESRLRRLFADNAAGIRALAVPMNGLLYLFGERRGAPTVLVAHGGRQGSVLLFTPELEVDQDRPQSASRLAQGTATLRAEAAALRADGVVRVIFVPVPTKLAVTLSADPALRDQIPELRSASPSGGSAAAYERLADELEREPGVSVARLQTAFTRRAAAGERLFVPEDTHWTSLGLSLAAAEVVRLWRGREVPVVKTGTLEDAPGDLQRMMALPGGEWFRTQPFVEELYTTAPAPAAGPCPPHTWLLGTSYSDHRGARLADRITRGSGCAVSDLSAAGNGPLGSLRQLRASGEPLAGTVVLWEFPFRDLADPRAFATPRREP